MITVYLIKFSRTECYIIHLTGFETDLINAEYKVINKSSVSSTSKIICNRTGIKITNFDDHSMHGSVIQADNKKGFLFHSTYNQDVQPVTCFIRDRVFPGGWNALIASGVSIKSVRP